MKPTIETPHFEHECENCIFLGRYQGNVYDLYYCQQHGHPTVIARYGNEAWEYSSGMPSSLPELVEAKRRAKEKGLI